MGVGVRVRVRVKLGVGPGLGLGFGLGIGLVSGLEQAAHLEVAPHDLGPLVVELHPPG